MRNALEKVGGGTTLEKYIPYWFAMNGAPLTARFVPFQTHAGGRLPLVTSTENDYTY